MITVPVCPVSCPVLIVIGFPIEPDLPTVSVALYVLDVDPPDIYTVSPGATPSPPQFIEEKEVHAFAHDVPIFDPVASLSTYHDAAFASEYPANPINKNHISIFNFFISVFLSM
jgi:hypothetical protein